MCTKIVIAIIVIIFIIFYYTKNELFVETPRGMNLYGLNSNTIFFPSATKSQCINLCANRSDCGGFWFYEPGQRCYLWAK